MMLKREIGKWDLVLLMINAIVGAGILGLPARLFQLLGVFSIVAIALTSVVVLVIALTFAQITKRFDASGGPYLYTLSAFGRTPAFIVGWMMLLSRAFTFAALLNLLISYTEFVSINSEMYRYSIICFVTGSLGVINLLGVKKSIVISNVFSSGKILFLLAFIVLGIFYIKEEAFHLPETVPSFEGFSSSALLLIFSLTGFEAVLVATGEIKKPRKNVGVALMISLALVALLYSCVQIVCIGLLPTLGASVAPLKDSVEQILGSAGGNWIGLLAVISILGTLNVSLLVGSRLLYSMAENNQLPGILSVVHARFGTPHFSILLFSAVLIWISLSGSFLESATISALAKLCIFLAMGLVLIKFDNDDRVNAGHTSARDRVMAVLCVAISIWLLCFMEGIEFVKFGTLLLIGVLILVATKVITKIAPVEKWLQKGKK